MGADWAAVLLDGSPSNPDQHRDEVLTRGQRSLSGADLDNIPSHLTWINVRCCLPCKPPFATRGAFGSLLTPSLLWEVRGHLYRDIALSSRAPGEAQGNGEVLAQPTEFKCISDDPEAIVNLTNH